MPKRSDTPLPDAASDDLLPHSIPLTLTIPSGLTRLVLLILPHLGYKLGVSQNLLLRDSTLDRFQQMMLHHEKELGEEVIVSALILARSEAAVY